MGRQFIVAQSQASADALTASLVNVGGGARPGGLTVVKLVWSPCVDASATLETFSTFASKIEDLLDDSGLDELVGVIDRANPAFLCAVSIGGWECLLAMLILSFPEVRWSFGLALTPRPPLPDWPEVAAATTLAQAELRGDGTALFDPSGLRNLVRKRTNLWLERSGDALRLPLRRERACVIEDETAFAYLHGCVAYRYGYRVELVTSWRQMSALFGGEGSHGFAILIEDLNLHFPDRRLGIHLSELEARARDCPKLDSRNAAAETSRLRIVVTTGPGRSGNAAQRIHEHLNAKANGIGKLVPKPTKGMADLWEQAGQFGAHKWLSDLGAWLWPELAQSQPRGNAPQFIFPPSNHSDVEEAIAHHGASGKLGLVVERLLARARRYAAAGDNVATLITGAVVARDALEISGLRSPALSLDALALLHKLELKGECQFSGLEFHIDLSHRRREIRGAVEATSHWFDPGMQARAALNAEMKMMHGLLPILREHGQFEEEQEWMGIVRWLQAKLWAGHGWRRVFLPILLYTSAILSSLTIFFIAIAWWVTVLTVMFMVSPGGESFSCSLGNAVTSMFSLNPPYSCNDYDAPQLLVSFAIVIGFLHLGIFISHLYSVLSRR